MHTIRLRGFWSVTTTPDKKAHLHSRGFGRPRTLDADERLWLVCTHVPGQAQILLNQTLIEELPAAGPLAIDITPYLQARNHLIFIVCSAAPLGEVALEVRRAGEK
jgi:hypothetical protein